MTIDDENLVGQKSNEHAQDARSEEELRHVLARDDRVQQPNEQQQRKDVKRHQLDNVRPLVDGLNLQLNPI